MSSSATPPLPTFPPIAVAQPSCATFCTQLYAADANVEEIRLLASHADIRATMIYTNVNPDRLTNAIDAVDTHRQGLSPTAIDKPQTSSGTTKETRC